MGLTHCPCGTSRPPGRHGRVAAAWLDLRDGVAAPARGTSTRLACRDCGRTRTLRDPGLHPRLDLTLALVDALLGDATRHSLSEVGARRGVGRRTVAALVEEELSAWAAGDLPDVVAVFAPPGAGGALLAVDPSTLSVLDAFSGLGCARVAPFLGRHPGPALACDWPAACAFRPHAAAEGRVSVPAPARLSWLHGVMPHCDDAFLSALDRGARAAARGGLALGSRHPLSLSIAEADALRDLLAGGPGLRRHLQARRAFLRALGEPDPGEAAAAHARWLAGTHPSTLAAFQPALAALGRMSGPVFADDAMEPDAWLAAAAATLPGLAPACVRQALLAHALADRGVPGPRPISGEVPAGDAPAVSRRR